MEARLQKLLRLMRELNPEEKIDENTMMRGTSLKKLAETGSGGYHRVVTWLEEKVREKKKEVGVDIVAECREQAHNCLSLMRGRNEKYGDSWKLLRLNSIVDLMAMKLDRCVKQELDNKAMEVELEDIVNYGLIGLTKIRKNLDRRRKD